MAREKLDRGSLVDDAMKKDLDGQDSIMAERLAAYERS